jgi:hypothetical protein
MGIGLHCQNVMADHENASVSHGMVLCDLMPDRLWVERSVPVPQ